MATVDPAPGRVEKRNRPPVSCEPCRTRKYVYIFTSENSAAWDYMLTQGYRLKCNRGLPCDACARRGLSSHCSYAANASRNKPAPSKPRELKDRLNTLESLVSSFLSGDPAIRPEVPTPNDSATGRGEIVASSAGGENGSVKQGLALGGTGGGEDALTPETPHLQETVDGQVNYIDPGHWLSILDDIKEVREHLSLSSQPASQTEAGSGTNRGVPDAFILSSGEDPRLDEVLSSLPSQPTCDMLLSWYFNSRFMVLGKLESTQ